jgi:hypothetical protein
MLFGDRCRYLHGKRIASFPKKKSSHLAGHFASGTRRFLTTMPELKVSSFVEAIVSVLLHVQLNIRVFNF